MDRSKLNPQSVLTSLLLAVAVVLTVLYLVLDAGPDKEAPRWMSYAAIVSAFAATFLGFQRRSRR